MRYWIVFIVIICVFSSSCKRRRDDVQMAPLPNIVSMQDVRNEINFNPEDEAWLEDAENIDNQVPPLVAQETPPVQVATPPAQPPRTETPPATPPSRPVTPPATTPTTPTRTTTPREVEHGEFTASLMSLRDRNRVEEMRRLLAANSYFTEIQEVEINGEAWYRLRLSGSFSRSYAEYLASKIQSEFREITGYWVMRR